MLIVDAQIHIWSGNKPNSPGHRKVPDFSADEAFAEMDEAGVDAAIIHPPGWDSSAYELAVAAAIAHARR